MTFAFVEVSSYESGTQNQSIPNMHLLNRGGNVSGFKIYYFFSAADTKNITLEPYYLAGGSASIEKISPNQYRAEIDFSNIELAANQNFPNSGNLQFGLHYSDWSAWNENDDFSNTNNQSVSINDKIVVISSSGDILAGTLPSENDLNLEPNIIKIYAKSQNENNFGKYQLYAKNEGSVPVTQFDFDIEFASENQNTPIIDEWYLPNTTKYLEQKDSNVWILHFSVRDINLEPEAIYPSESGFSFGVHYADWSNFDPTDDYALAEVNANYSVNEKIPVYIDGRLVFGNPKIHNLIDVKKIIAIENGYTLEEFDTPVESIFDTTLDIKMTWDELESIKNTLFEDVPNFDTTSIAFFQILDKFSGLDTLYLAQNFKDIRNIFAQLVSLRFMHYINNLILPKKSLSLKKNSVSGLYDKYKELNKYEIKLLVINPMKFPGSYRAYNRAKLWATEYAKDSTNGDDQHTKADGYRHSVWNALLCRETGTQYDDISDCLKWAEDFTNAHEKTSDEGMSKSMDLHNNKIGRDKYSPKLTVGCEWDLGFACVNEEVVGPSREETKQMYWKLADIAVAFNDENQLKKSPWIRRIVFFKDKNGKYYCLDNEDEKKDECKAFESPELMASKIAVLKKDQNFTCNEEFSFRLDLEDDDNGSKIVSGDPNPPGIVVGDGGITFTYCALQMADFDDQIPRVPYDYIVLRMDNDCPEGTYAFSRHHDTEDSHNANTSTGNLGPNVVTKNATLEYCFVPADVNSTLEYPFAKEYGVFANFSSANVVHSKIYMDDEDSNNANSWGWYDTPSDIKEKIEVIMNGSSNTIYYVVKWIEIVLAKIMNWMGV